MTQGLTMTSSLISTTSPLFAVRLCNSPFLIACRRLPLSQTSITTMLQRDDRPSAACPPARTGLNRRFAPSGLGAAPGTAAACCSMWQRDYSWRLAVVVHRVLFIRCSLSTASTFMGLSTWRAPTICINMMMYGHSAHLAKTQWLSCGVT